MEKIKLSKTTIGFALFIIISASFFRQVFNFLSNTIGTAGVSLILASLFIAGGVATFFQLWKLRPGLKRTLLFLGIMGLGFFYASQMGIMVERMHLIKYGLLGWLVSVDMVRHNKVLFGVSFSLFFCLFTSVIDEAFQWWLPYRVGDIRDIGFAGIGAIWGISLFLICKELTKNKGY